MELLGHPLCQHSQKTGRGDVENPGLKTGRGGEIFGEAGNIFRSQIDEEALSDDEGVGAPAAELGEKIAAGRSV